MAQTVNATTFATMNDLVLAILSDTITYPTPWQHTAFVVTIGMIPLLSVCALWGWSAVRNMVGKWTLRGVVVALMVAFLFDCVSVAQYPVPSKGAVVVTGYVGCSHALNDGAIQCGHCTHFSTS